MKKEIIISGFGGQGVLSMGKILAYSGLMEDKEVTWMPAYGPEQRGGTANVTVIVSDERISSPILSQYDVAIVLNQPSLDKFLPKVKPGGILIYDGYGILNPPQRDDITVYRIDAMDKAAEMKNSKVFNMIVLGGLLKVCPVVSTDGLQKALYKSLPERHHHLIPLNMQAVEERLEINEYTQGNRSGCINFDNFLVIFNGETRIFCIFATTKLIHCNNEKAFFSDFVSDATIWRCLTCICYNTSGGCRCAIADLHLFPR